METHEENYEMDNRSGQNLEGPDANMPIRRLTASSIIGDDIENTEGENLGSIKDLMISLDEGSIEYAVIKFGGFLGLGEKLFAIPWKEFQLDPLREVFILNREKEYLKKAPGFNENHWPNTNVHYEDINAYWGVSGFAGGFYAFGA